MSRSTKSRKRGKASAGCGKKRQSPVPAPRVERQNVGGVEVSSMVMRQVGTEVLREDWEPAAWARALVAGNGSRDDTLSHYAQIRVEELTEKEGDRKTRRRDLEVRCKDSFQNVERVPIIPPGEMGQRKVLGLVDSVFWHMVAMVAGAGTLMAANILWPGLGIGVTWEVLILVVVAMQLIPLAAWRAGRGGFTGVTYSQASQMAACFAVLGSVVVGCGVFMTEPGYHGTMERQVSQAGGGLVEMERAGAPNVTLSDEPMETEEQNGERDGKQDESDEAVESEDALGPGKTVVSAGG